VSVSVLWAMLPEMKCSFIYSFIASPNLRMKTLSTSICLVNTTEAEVELSAYLMPKYTTNVIYLTFCDALYQ